MSWLDEAYDKHYGRSHVHGAAQAPVEPKVQFNLEPEKKETPVRNKYMREIAPGVWVDVYDVLYAWKVTDPCLQHLIKKALAVGQRGHKDTRQDLIDIRDSAIRAIEHYDLLTGKE